MSQGHGVPASNSCQLLLVRVGGYIVNLRLLFLINKTLFLQAHRETLKTDRFFAASGVQLAQTHPGGQFTFRRAAFLTQLQSKVGLALAKAGVPVPRPTQCVRGA
jgi:hypothetical protein